jgi:hypothetical protein
MLAERDRTGWDQISLTDPGSGAMAAHTHGAVGHDVRFAVDTQHKVTIEQRVTRRLSIWSY